MGRFSIFILGLVSGGLITALFFMSVQHEPAVSAGANVSPLVTSGVPVIQTCFVPGATDCAGVIAAEIDQVKIKLDVQAYNFTEPHIAAAIEQAKSRGVTVRIILDKTAPRERGGKADEVASSGVPVWIDYKPHIAHNKVMILDDQEIIGGSFNYTTSADLHNAENVIIVHDRNTAAAYENNFLSRLADSRSYQPEVDNGN